MLLLLRLSSDGFEATEIDREIGTQNFSALHVLNLLLNVVRRLHHLRQMYSLAAHQHLCLARLVIRRVVVHVVEWLLLAKLLVREDEGRFVGIGYASLAKE